MKRIERELLRSSKWLWGVITFFGFAIVLANGWKWSVVLGFFIIFSGLWFFGVDKRSWGKPRTKQDLDDIRLGDIAKMRDEHVIALLARRYEKKTSLVSTSAEEL